MSIPAKVVVVWSSVVGTSIAIVVVVWSSVVGTSIAIVVVVKSVVVAGSSVGRSVFGKLPVVVVATVV